MNGNVLTATNSGSIKVTAWQAGDSTWSHTDPMCQMQTASGAGPVISATSSTNASATTLTFTGTVNPGGLATTAYFEYGPTDAYGSTVAVALSPDDGVAVQDVSTIVTGLTPGATCFFRLVATNSKGTTYGVPRQATTLAADDPLPPAVTLTLSGNPMLESGGVATVSAILSSVRAQQVTVNLEFTGTAQPSVDYTISDTKIVIPPGAISGSIVLTALQDELYENPDETIDTTVVSVVNGTEDGVQRVTATIRDDDLQAFPLVAGQRGTVACLANPSIGYDVYLPPNYASNQTVLPIVYTFNPSGGGMVSDFQSVCANLQVIVVGFNGFRNGVGWDDVYREVDAVAKDIRQRVRFDPTAEIASGFSGGGVACYGFSRIRPQHVAGIYPMAGWMGATEFITNRIVCPRVCWSLGPPAPAISKPITTDPMTGTS